MPPKWKKYGKNGYELVFKIPPTLSRFKRNEKWPYFVLAEIEKDDEGWYVESVLGCTDVARKFPVKTLQEAREKAEQVVYQLSRLVYFEFK